MKWVKAKESDLEDMGRKHYRDAKTKMTVSAGVVYSSIKIYHHKDEFEVLDETPPPAGYTPVSDEGILNAVFGDANELFTSYEMEQILSAMQKARSDEAAKWAAEIERGKFWTDENILEFAVRSHLPGKELTIEEFITLKSLNQ